MREISVERIVALDCAIVFSIGQIFEESGKSLIGLPPVGINREAAKPTPSFIGIWTLSILTLYAGGGSGCGSIRDPSNGVAIQTSSHICRKQMSRRFHCSGFTSLVRNTRLVIPP